MDLNEAFELVDKLQKEEGAPLFKHIIKLGEELGEISESYLMLDGYKDSKTSTEEEANHLREETIDALIVCCAILSAMDTPTEFLQNTLKEKIQKWRNRYERQKLAASQEKS